MNLGALVVHPGPCDDSEISSFEHPVKVSAQILHQSSTWRDLPIEHAATGDAIAETLFHVLLGAAIGAKAHHLLKKPLVQDGSPRNAAATGALSTERFTAMAEGSKCCRATS